MGPSHDPLLIKLNDLLIKKRIKPIKSPITGPIRVPYGSHTGPIRDPTASWTPASLPSVAPWWSAAVTVITSRDDLNYALPAPLKTCQKSPFFLRFFTIFPLFFCFYCFFVFKRAREGPGRGPGSIFIQIQNMSKNEPRMTPR